MRYGDLCEEKLVNAKILYGNARVLELLWAMRILEVSTLGISSDSNFNTFDFRVITNQN